MDTKEEMIEEIDVMEDLSADSKSEEEIKNEDVQVEAAVTIPVIEEESLPSEINNEDIAVESKPEEEKNTNEEISNSEVVEEFNDNAQEQVIEEPTKKNKTPLIVLLSILLVLDIAALFIYMIGIEKVISFIK